MQNFKPFKLSVVISYVCLCGKVMGQTGKDLDKLYLNFSQPDITAFGLLGTNPSTINKPGNIKDLAADVGSFVDFKGNLKPGLALEWAPFQKAGSLSNYRNFSFSGGTLGDGKDTRFGVGAKWFWSSRGLELERALNNTAIPLATDRICIALLRNDLIAYDSIRNFVAKFRNLHYTQVQDLLLKQHLSPVSSDSIIQVFGNIKYYLIGEGNLLAQNIQSGLSWNRNSGAISGGFTGRSLEGNLIKSSNIEAIAIISQWQGNFGINKSKWWNRHTGYVLNVNYQEFLNGSVIDSASLARQRITLGGRFLIGNANHRFSLEGAYINEANTSIVIKNILWRFSAGVELNIGEGLFLELAVGSVGVIKGTNTTNLQPRFSLKKAINTKPRFDFN